MKEWIKPTIDILSIDQTEAENCTTAGKTNGVVDGDFNDCAPIS